jgi:hypothetical protein
MAGFTLRVRGVLSLEVVRELSASRFRASAWPRLAGSWGARNRSQGGKDSNIPRARAGAIVGAISYPPSNSATKVSKRIFRSRRRDHSRM